MENNNEMLPEEEDMTVMTLIDDDGQEHDFEYLDDVEYEGDEYVVLMAAEQEATEIVILRVEPVDEETENYLGVEDEETLNAVYAIFKERYKDVLTFAEE